ncbi:hypothetical protein BT63DRAFT_424591 [Microthyrium microscopicum]|uniref:Hydrophobin n=1 Tax=Microthyrium microscopicum TaxID=703497 RepID=A0A6A6UFS0_9PEZI|nr:hypothetical protein BT63DRAFT_424591 [Microthyrium microscopicum]
MYFLKALFFPIVFAAFVFAGHNCKCQDNSGQYNDYTQICCAKQAAPNAVLKDIVSSAVTIAATDPEDIFADLVAVGSIIYDLIEEFSIEYHGDQHHQCSSWDNHIDSGAFVQCCNDLGVGDGHAFCWD